MTSVLQDWFIGTGALNYPNDSGVTLKNIGTYITSIHKPWSYFMGYTDDDILIIVDHIKILHFECTTLGEVRHFNLEWDLCYTNFLQNFHIQF